MLKNVRHVERGQALIETALFTPLLLVLLAGSIEIGQFAHYAIIVHNAARAGVQYGAQSLITADDNTGMQNAALNDGQNLSGLSAVGSNYCECSDGSSVTTPCSPPPACSSNHRVTYVKVTTAATFNAFFKFPGLPKSLTINGSEVMRVAQ